jgi:hypothetical protein
MKLFILVAIIVSITYVAPAGTAQIAQAPRSKDGRIAHVEHNGLSFAIKIDGADDRFLTIDIPRKTGAYARSSLPAVRLKILWSGDSTIEGPAELMPGAVSMGGWDEINYRFALQRHTVVDDIHSVTTSIGDQTYTVMPF